MAAIRVFLLACRRPRMLERALASLRAQTFTDWVCELHNDAPEDEAPGRLLDAIRDPRIVLHRHDRNWGALAGFNHAYQGGPEPYAAILEDDNWWDPEFLSIAHAALARTPEANVVWANMRLWKENPAETWTDTGRTIWARTTDDTPRLFHWPQPLQMTDALHSHGAMLFRVPASAGALVPDGTPLAIIEPVRERLLAGGWLLLPRPLANFALTLGTARPPNRTLWAQSQLLVAGSYLASVKNADSRLGVIWRHLREQRPAGTPLLFQLALSGIRPIALLRHARAGDWLRFLAGAVRHPIDLARAFRFRADHAALWKILLEAARARSDEGAVLPAGSLVVFDKKTPLP